MATATLAFAGTWFDGRTARACPVQVQIDGSALTLRADDGEIVRTAPLRTLVCSEPTLHAPRFVYFDDGSTLEVGEAAQFNRALDALGRPPTLVARLQRSAGGATLALALLIGTIFLAWQNGIPALARWAAFALPADVEARIGEQVERTLDLEMLAASALPEARQAQLRSLLEGAAARGAPGLAFALKLRGVQDGEGVNAFSLPGGSVIVLDGLVNLAHDDTQVLAVFGHELGHLAHKHGLRNLLQVLGIGAMAGAIWGDFAGVAANVPVIFGALRYSREFELEADRFAADFLRANGLDTQPLIEFFELVAARREADGAGLPDMLSTHPQTKDRIERLRQMQ
jgi:predicted Zn-dependent protease